MKVKTNNHWRNFLYGYELPSEQRSEFDWLSDEEYNTGAFVKYRNIYYELSQFVRTPESLKPWDGVHGDSYFSGVVIRVSDDGEQYIIGTYLS